MTEQGMDPTVMMALTALILPLVGFMMAATPYLMRRGEVFAVTVPTAAQQDSYLKGLKRRYAAMVAAVSLVLTAATLALALGGVYAGVIVMLVVGSFAILGIGYGLMQFYRAKTKAYKHKQGWVAGAQESVAVVDDRPVPQVISLKWNLLYLPIMALTLAIGVLGYAQMPDQIPLQMGFDGSVSRWADKTPLIPFMPVLIQGFFGVCLTFSHWTIMRSKKWSEPGAPATSALAYGMFAHAQSLYLVVGGLLIAGAMATMPLTFIGIISMGQAAIGIMVAALAMCIGAIAVSVVYGQAGSRVFLRMQGSDTLLADDDSHWKFGIFYVNRDDPSLFLPERFGVGWTTNWARPAVWALLVAGLAITAGFVVAVLVLF